MKTHILLQRAGRDQFGDSSGDYTFYRSPGLSRKERTDHHAAVMAFHNQYWKPWQSFCADKTSKQVWLALCPRGSPAFSTFEKQRRAFVSFEEFLRYALVLYRWHALAAMGISDEKRRAILARYEVLSRYYLEPKVGERKPGRSAGYVPRSY
ncbi:MAG TPA: hypothetical protein VHD62_15235 [Opitutaceae bacterium]|nr:hypothetical protein [Opitutaceae bacterium]